MPAFADSFGEAPLLHPLRMQKWWWRMDSNQEAPVRNPSDNQRSCESGQSECTHGSAHGFVQLWHELAQIVEMWPWVSAETRKAILTLLRAAHGGGHDAGGD